MDAYLPVVEPHVPSPRSQYVSSRVICGAASLRPAHLHARVIRFSSNRRVYPDVPCPAAGYLLIVPERGRRARRPMYDRIACSTPAVPGARYTAQINAASRCFGTLQTMV